MKRSQSAYSTQHREKLNTLHFSAPLKTKKPQEIVLKKNNQTQNV
jgi:hypothetical protein